VKKRRCAFLVVLLGLFCGGAFAQASAGASGTNELIPASSVTAQKVASILSAAYVKTSIDDDGDVKIFGKNGLKVYITVNQKLHLLRFYGLFRLRGDATEKQKLRFVNRVNDEIIFCRFAIVESGGLRADYHLRFGDGITPGQIVATYRLFLRTTTGSILTKDDEKIVK